MKKLYSNLSLVTILFSFFLISVQVKAQITDSLDLVWQDEFDGTQLDNTKWNPCPEWQRHDSYWEADNIALTGSGQLQLSMTEVEGKILCGAIRTRDLYYQKYGYFEVRCTIPRIAGGWVAFWSMPDDNQPGNEGIDGTEIDVMETINSWDYKIGHATHWDGYGADHKSDGITFDRPDLYDGNYHTFGVWWAPTGYIFYIDGVETFRTSAGGVGQVEQYLKLTMEAASWAAGWVDMASQAKPVYWYVDYVRTYQSKTLKTQEETKKELVKIYPNPTNGIINFSKQVNVKVTNAVGQLITAKSNINSVDISNQASGVYFISITDDNGNIIQQTKTLKK